MMRDLAEISKTRCSPPQACVRSGLGISGPTGRMAQPKQNKQDAGRRDRTCAVRNESWYSHSGNQFVIFTKKLNTRSNQLLPFVRLSEVNSTFHGFASIPGFLSHTHIIQLTQQSNSWAFISEKVKHCVQKSYQQFFKQLYLWQPQAEKPKCVFAGKWD